MSTGAGRRDTPAARAALARRRQRAAQSLRPTPSVATTTPSAAMSSISTSSLAATNASSRPPTGISSPPRWSPTNPATTTTTAYTGLPTTTHPPKLTVDTTPTMTMHSMHLPAKETTTPTSNATNDSRGFTQLTRRAHDKKKSPRSSDATLTTTGLTTTTSTAATSIAASTAASPEQNVVSRLSQYTLASSSSTITTTPQQALSNSQQAAEKANSILNAVNARRQYHLSNSPKVGEQPADIAIPTTAVAPHTRKASSPSRLAQQEELLAASKRRRQALESRHRMIPENATASTKVETITAPKTLRGTPPSPTAAKAMTNPRYLRGVSKSPSPLRSASFSLTNPTRPSTNTGSGPTLPPDSPLMARLAKLDPSSDSQQRWQQQQQKQQLLLQNQHSSQSPARQQQPPTHVEQRSSVFKQQQQHRPHVRSRSPSPQRKTTASPWTEKNASQQVLEGPRPTPVQLSRQEQSSPGRMSLQARAMEQARRGRSSSPMLQRLQGVAKTQPFQQPSPHRLSNEKNRNGNSPDVDRLSSFLMDMSLASTIADMTMHQMESPPRNKNNTSFVQSLPSTPASPTLGRVQPFQSPPHSQQPTTTVTDANGDFSMTMVASQDQTPSLSRNRAYRPIDEIAKDHDVDLEGDTLDSEKVQTIDASCLQSGCTIVLRSYSHCMAVGIDRERDKYCMAALTGHGLGREDEILRIQKVISTSEGRKNHNSFHGGVSPILQHGDTVLLHSAAAGNMALGSRKFVNSTGTAAKLELGFFSASGGHSEIWTILKARPDQEVLVGRAALVASHASKDLPSSTIDGVLVGMPVNVRSGDPILLRNCYNGGILSVNAEGKLVILTDSYQHKQQQYSHSEDQSLLGQLLQHDRLYPTPRDTFQMILSSVPPCPPWVAACSIDERIFLSGSYLLQPRRNQTDGEFKSNLFEGNRHARSILQAAQRYVPSDENLNPKTKESILIDEIIGSFLGLEGLHIRLTAAKGYSFVSTSTDRFEFQLFETDGVTFDIGLRNLVEQILPLATSFVRVRNFVASRHPGYEYGCVMQAFCEALDALLQDYVHFVSQLEWQFRKYSKSEILTLRSIYFQITPCLHSMSIMEAATEAAFESKGGKLLNSLWSLEKRRYAGDSVAKKVLGILLDKASEPYMEILSVWLQSGKLNDPYEEFMVRRGVTHGRGPADGDSWLALFQINSDHVVQGIAPNDWAKEKIMMTGKYWNAVRECRLDLKDHPGPTKQWRIPKLPFNSDSSAIASFIDSKHQNASMVLVRILMDNFKLLESLETMKRYFLIDQGEFLANFLDAAEDELLKPLDDISMGRLQHWLNMSVQLTEAHREEWDVVSGTRIPTTPCPLFPGGLRCRLSEVTLVAHLDSLYGGGISDQGPPTPSRRAYGTSFHGPTGIEVFTIDFPRVPFPISLLLSQKAMSDYRLLFRHLFFTKHVERRLIGVWRDHQLLKKLDSLRGLLGPTFLLRQRMLHFIQNLIYYMVFEVVESHWMDMRNAIGDKSYGPSGRSDKQQTVDDLLEVHNNFLERTLEACLLTNCHLIRSLTKLMNTCLLFTDQMKRFMDTTKIHHDSINRAAEKRGAVHRNLNERSLAHGQQDKRALRKALASAREEREAINNRQTRRVGREVSSDSYQRMVLRFDEVFNQDLANFMRQLNTHTVSGIVANLGVRLDYNGYVTTAMAKNGK